MPESIDERIRRYVNPQTPLGPSDAAQIKDIEVAAHLFYRHNNSFTSLLREDLSVVIGRRGSGKTALLNSYKYRPYLAATGSKKEREPQGSDFSAYDIVIEISTHKKFEEMQRRVVRDPDVIRPIEGIVEDWAKLIIDYFLATLLSEAPVSKQANVHLATIHNYLRQDEDQFRDEIRRQVWGEFLLAKFNAFRRAKKTGIGRLSQDQIMAKAEDYLESEKKKAVIMFDSMDEYPIGNHAFDRTVGALVRFISHFNSSHTRIKIKLVLPSEIFPEVQKAAPNPLKDWVSFAQVQWSPIELMKIAAHRYHIFLQSYDRACLKQLGPLDLTRREDVHRFWARFFPETHTNRYGVEEDAITYVLRHTQLLPRQLLMILQTIVMNSHELTGGYRQFNSEVIRTAIEKMEPVIAGEIFAAFRPVYAIADEIGRAVFGNCPTMFSYDQLEDRWRKRGRRQMSKINADFEMVHFQDMLIRMGIMGLVVEGGETERYYQGKFGHSSLTPFNIGEGNLLCLHPIFSKYFNASKNAKSKAILPQGVSMDG